MVERRILRYELRLVPGRATINAPPGALRVGIKPSMPNVLHIWVEAAAPSPDILRVIEIVATGTTIEVDNLRFIGMVITPTELVWHVYERTR